MDNVVSKEVNRNQIKFMQWDITKKCNLRCKHCRSTSYYDGADGDKIIDLTTEEVFKTLDDLAKNGVNRIHFLGGEPFMRKDLFEIISYAGKLGIVCSVNTNGTLITKEMIPKIFESNIYLLTFSIDGATAATNDKVRGEGVFDIVCKTIKEIDQARKKNNQFLRMIYTPVITKINRHESKQLCFLAKELGLDSVIFTTLRKKGRAKDNIEELGLSCSDELDVAEEIAGLMSTGFKQHIQLGIGSPLTAEYLNKKYSINLPIIPGGCNSLITKGFIQPDSTLFPCQELTNYYFIKDEKKEMNRKRIVDSSFKEIWNSNETTNLTNKLFTLDMKNNNIPCNTCKYLLTYCYPCPLPSLKGGEKSYHQSCLETFLRAGKNNISLTDELFHVDSSTVLHKAIGNPLFRHQFLRDRQKSLTDNKFVLSENEERKLNDVMNSIRANVSEYLKNLTKKGVLENA